MCNFAHKVRQSTNKDDYETDNEHPKLTRDIHFYGGEGMFYFWTWGTA